MKFPVFIAHDAAGLLPIAVLIAAAGGAVAVGVSGALVRIRKTEEARKIGKWLLAAAGLGLVAIVFCWFYVFHIH
jgi:hypothetical protein